MISFTKWTTLEECIEIPDNFPSITFSLTPFQDVPSLVEKNHFYVDVMGIITEVGATATIRPKSSNTDNLKRTLQISDASGCTLPVTLWGKTTTAFEAQAIFNAGQIEPQVVVFVGTLVRNYKGIGLTLTGSSPCKWYVNLDMPEVTTLKQSFTAKFQPIKWVDDGGAAFGQDILQKKLYCRSLVSIHTSIRLVPLYLPADLFFFAI